MCLVISRLRVMLLGKGWEMEMEKFFQWVNSPLSILICCNLHNLLQFAASDVVNVAFLPQLRQYASNAANCN